jgi:hypothetical protein
MDDILELQTLIAEDDGTGDAEETMDSGLSVLGCQDHSGLSLLTC